MAGWRLEKERVEARAMSMIKVLMSLQEGIAATKCGAAGMQKTEGIEPIAERKAYVLLIATDEQA